MAHTAPSPLSENGQLSRALANEMLTLDFNRLSALDQRQLERLIFDHIGVANCGARLPFADGLRTWFDANAGNGNAQLIGSPLIGSVAAVAFVNASCAHGLEMDDTHDESVSHPGAPVIASALAVAAHRNLNGREVLAAIAAGYETIGRVGAATGADSIIEQGFHPTSLFTGFGVATTVAKLIGLSADQLQHAWGLCLSMVGGSMQFSQETVGTTVKRLHAGFGALHGVMAAELASAGIDGPMQAFDGSYGLCNNFGTDPDGSRLQKIDATAELEIHRISFKPYPCCRLFHSTLDGLREVTEQFKIKPKQIASLRVGGPSILVSQHMITRPESTMAAQYSLPYTLAAAFYYGPTSVAGFTAEAMQDQRLYDVADKVTAEFSEEMEAEFPAHFGSWIELTDNDGQVRRADVLDSLGTPARPMSEEVLLEKFIALNNEILSNDQAQRILSLVGSLGEDLPVQQLLEGLNDKKMQEKTA